MKLRRKKNSSPLSNPLSLKSVPSRPLPKSGQGLGTNQKPPRNLWERITRLRLKRRFKFTWKKFFISLGIVLAVLVLAASGIFAYYAPQLPNPKKISERAIAQSTKILDRNRTPIYTFHGEENRTVVTGGQISPFTKQATVAVEDASFYKNSGFDLRGVLRAVAVHLHILHRDLSGGGSTITQQYVKNALLTDANGQIEGSGNLGGTLNRKLKELILSVEVEQNYSKDEILTGYLNQIPYGNSTYGIESASQTYFGKSAKDLTLSEAATLAAVPNAPTYYSPYGNHLDDLFARKDYILDRMVAVGYISKDDAVKAKADAPSVASPAFKSDSSLVAPHFVFYVKEQLINYLGGDPQVAEQKLDDGGYTVVTSLDLPTQDMAQQVLSDLGPTTIKKYNGTNACITAVDPKTGEVLAMVGSIDYNNSRSGNTNFCTAKLQPGSSFKPIVYATAFGPSYSYAPSSITYDLSTDFGGGYRPADYDLKNRGPITNRNALAGSLNIPAVKNLSLIGVSTAIDTAKAMGISTLTDTPSNYGLPLVLGSGSVEPVEMADVYATFANNGNYTPLRPLLKIEKDGKAIKDFTTTTSKKVLEPEVAYEISNILSDANAKQPIFGSLTKNLTLTDRPVAAKTGTTDSFRDAWTVGYTPSIAVAVWVGNNDPGKTMSKGSDGSIVAAPIWNKFISTYLKGKPVEQFDRPSTVKDVQVDKLSGKLPTDQTPNDDKITDIFAPWQVPTTGDDVHVKVKIDKISGKLATDLTPDTDVVEQTYFNVHSEKPKNSSWENPVQDWAKANGGGTNPPTDKDDVHTEDNRPSITFVSPHDASTIASSTLHIEVAPGGTKPISKVDLTLNGASIGTLTQAPWTLDQDISTLSAGSQVLTATVTNNIDMTKSDQVSFTVAAAPVVQQPAKDVTPPGAAINPTVNQDAKISVPTKQFHVTWTNPADVDLASVNIYMSTSPDAVDLGTKVKAVPAQQPGLTTSVDIEVGSLTAKTYYFTIRPVDSSGNENLSTTKISAKLSS